ncbi:MULTISPECIES: hypothetical protein [unclassified Brenneria]|uniref:hypothetical protein n=1 Tax=unclassified Brenneria TaxID=2634434 RepID=UPI0029C16E83|nr:MULTISPECIES: hypothetical protein [unclassified Brenneria]MDX5629955.1 hypothetical protein [Brenneria sp. L3-3Z]MDX5697101.1 hypothetical protein [Brenneria sp. L4-2C]
MERLSLLPAARRVGRSSREATVNFPVAGGLFFSIINIEVRYSGFEAELTIYRVGYGRRNIHRKAARSRSLNAGVALNHCKTSV